MKGEPPALGEVSQLLSVKVSSKSRANFQDSSAKSKSHPLR